jgi:hypothetical protein
MTAKTEDELKREFAKYAGKETGGAWIIVAALVFEAALLWRYSVGKLLLETTLFIIADLGIAAGVYLEIHFGRKAASVAAELQQRSDLRIAELNNETARLRKQISPRHLNSEAFIKALEGKPKLPVEIWFLKDDGEAFNLALQIRDCLRLAKWEAREPSPIPLSSVPELARLPAAMAAGGQPSGVSLVAHWLTREEVDALGSGPFEKPMAIPTPFVVLHKALFASLGALAGSGGHSSALSEGLLRIVVGARP